MSSSDGTGSVRKIAARKPAARKPAARKSGAVRQEIPASGSGTDNDGLADPWFTPGPKVEYAGAGLADAGLADTGSHAVQGEWFLPSGRAGLHPDSMTESWDEDATAEVDRAGRAVAAGAPPWGRESASVGAGEPPPWETGPWPGPGEGVPRRPPRAAGSPDASELAAGDPAGRELRLRSLLIMAGAGVLVLVVVIVVIVVAVSGGSASGCATYPAPVRHAYARAMSDLSGHAGTSVLAADLAQAASVANSSAVTARQISARTALFAMATDLDAAYSDVSTRRPLAPDLLQRLAADGNALPRSC